MSLWIILITEVSNRGFCTQLASEYRISGGTNATSQHQLELERLEQGVWSVAGNNIRMSDIFRL
jgi:hypothetical protein